MREALPREKTCLVLRTIEELLPTGLSHDFVQKGRRRPWLLFGGPFLAIAYLAAACTRLVVQAFKLVRHALTYHVCIHIIILLHIMIRMAITDFDNHDDSYDYIII